MDVEQLLKDFDDRLAMLERENSRLKGKVHRQRWALLAVPLIGLACAGLMAAEPRKAEVADTIDAKKLRIVDDDGKPRIVIGTIKDKAIIILFDEDGKRRSDWLAGKEGANFTHYTSTGKDIMNIEAGADGTVMDFKDLQGNLRLILGMTDTGKKPRKPAVIIYDADGNPLFFAPK